MGTTEEDHRRGVDDDAEPCSTAPKLRVGCALLPKKVSRYLTPSMLAVAAGAGLELCLVDPAEPLELQGPFDAIIHKLRPDAAWEHNLQGYTTAHPEVRVIDRVDGIRLLQNRATMLNVLNGNGIALDAAQEGCRDGGGAASVVRIQRPLQVELPEGISVADARARLAAAGLHPPLLVKPVWTDGREGSHGLAMLHDLQSLEALLRGGGLSADLQPPLVVQQYVKHGGVLYKVYVLGGQTFVTTRPSLGECHTQPDAASSHAGVRQLPRVSCSSLYRDRPPTGDSVGSGQVSASFGHSRGPSMDEVGAAASGADASPDDAADPPAASAGSANGASANGSGDGSVHGVDLPPEWLTASLAAVLRQRLGLQLFNFDLICPQLEHTGVPGSLYYVVDINYFPGVDKIPDFERMFVRFLRAAAAPAAAPAAAADNGSS